MRVQVPFSALNLFERNAGNTEFPAFFFSKYYNFQLGCPPLKVEPPADCRGTQMKAPSEHVPRGKYAGGVLENRANMGQAQFLPKLTSSFFICSATSASPISMVNSFCFIFITKDVCNITPVSTAVTSAKG